MTTQSQSQKDWESCAEGEIAMTCHATLPYAAEARTLAHQLCHEYTIHLFWIEINAACDLEARYRESGSSLPRPLWVAERVSTRHGQ